MAEKKNQETRTKLEEINDSLSGIEQKFEQHKNLIYIIVGAILVIALGIWAFTQYGYAPRVEKAKTEIAKADDMLLKPALQQGAAVTTQDSTNALQVYESVAKKYGDNLILKNGEGNRAKLMAAQILYAREKYAEAQKYLEDYSPKGKIIGPSSQILLGDTYVNQQMYDKAIKAYDNAIDLSKDSFWSMITWREIILFLLALCALATIVFEAKRKDDPNRTLALIASVVIFLASAGLLAYMLSNKKGHENKSLISFVMQKKANVLDAQKNYDEEVKIYEEIEAKYTGPGSMTMQIERAKAKAGK
ncbi:MAG: hypothetical protein J5629_10765 [Muribaculaceae bacterium]|nr:hypothetical protein [Muribaculaceae bacterium]